MTTTSRLPPIHPGEVFREEFLIPTGLTAYAVARACGIPRRRRERLTRSETPITADTALRLGSSSAQAPPSGWNLQARFDLERRGDEVMAGIDRIKPMKAA